LLAGDLVVFDQQLIALYVPLRLRASSFGRADVGQSAGEVRERGAELALGEAQRRQRVLFAAARPGQGAGRVGEGNRDLGYLVMSMRR